MQHDLIFLVSLAGTMLVLQVLVDISSRHVEMLVAGGFMAGMILLLYFLLNRRLAASAKTLVPSEEMAMASNLGLSRHE